MNMKLFDVFKKDTMELKNIKYLYILEFAFKLSLFLN